MHLTDVIRTYLYGSINNDIYMKIPEEIKLLEVNSIKPRSMTQSSYNDFHGDLSNPYTCGTIALVSIY